MLNFQGWLKTCARLYINHCKNKEQPKLVLTRKMVPIARQASSFLVFVCTLITAVEKKYFFFLLLIEYVALMLRKKIRFLHGSVRRYKTLGSSTNCGCGHLMPHFVGIAIITVAFT